MIKRLLWTYKYIVATIRHKRFVLIAGRKLPKKYRVSWYRLLIHDWSKFTISEAPHYGRHFFGDKQAPDKFEKAWLHHIHKNPHHWQHWIFQDGKYHEMPKKFVKEMITDWMGAEKAYNGSWDMSGWLLANLNKIQINDNTREYVYKILEEIGYKEVIIRVKQKAILDEAIKQKV